MLSLFLAMNPSFNPVAQTTRIRFVNVLFSSWSCATKQFAQGLALLLSQILALLKALVMIVNYVAIKNQKDMVLVFCSQVFIKSWAKSRPRQFSLLKASMGELGFFGVRTNNNVSINLTTAHRKITMDYHNLFIKRADIRNCLQTAAVSSFHCMGIYS